MAWSAPSCRPTSSSAPRAATPSIRSTFTCLAERRHQYSVLNQPGEGYVAVEYLFLQFAGFTFGKSASAYANALAGLSRATSRRSCSAANNTDTGVNNIQYTAQFGNGVSGTIGLDDPVVWDRTAVYNLSLAAECHAGDGSNAYAGVQCPDIVGNIRVDQAWGLFQFRLRRTRSAAPTTS